MKPYRVVIEHEVWVVAESARAAEVDARDALRDEEIEGYAVEVTARTHRAPDEDSYIPYGEKDRDDPDRTVAQWRETLGVPWTPTPEEAALFAKLRAFNAGAKP